MHHSEGKKDKIISYLWLAVAYPKLDWTTLEESKIVIKAVKNANFLYIDTYENGFDDF